MRSGSASDACGVANGKTAALAWAVKMTTTAHPPHLPRQAMGAMEIAVGPSCVGLTLKTSSATPMCVAHTCRASPWSPRTHCPSRLVVTVCHDTLSAWAVLPVAKLPGF